MKKETFAIIRAGFYAFETDRLHSSWKGFARKILIVFTPGIFAIIVSSPVVDAQGLFDPAPLPNNKFFITVELGYNYRLNTAPVEQRDFPGSQGRLWDFHPLGQTKTYFTSEISLMKNMTVNYALGASIFNGVDWDAGLRGGFKVKYRRWITPYTSVDLSSGILLWDNRQIMKFPGFLGGVSLNFNEWFSLYAHLEYVRYQSDEGSSTDLPIFTGFKFGSTPGLILHAGVGAITLIFLSL